MRQSLSAQHNLNGVLDKMSVRRGTRCNERPTSFNYALAQLLEGEWQLQVFKMKFAALAMYPTDGDICTDCSSMCDVIVCGGRRRAVWE